MKVELDRSIAFKKIPIEKERLVVKHRVRNLYGTFESQTVCLHFAQELVYMKERLMLWGSEGARRLDAGIIGMTA